MKKIVIIAIILLAGVFKTVEAQTEIQTKTEVKALTPSTFVATSPFDPSPRRLRTLERRNKKEIAKENAKIRIIHHIDTVYIIDTVYQIVQRTAAADTLFYIGNVNKKRAVEIDSIINVLFSENYLENINSYTKVSLANDSILYDSKIKDISDSDLEKRFSLMYTQIDLPYHPMLKRFISRYIDNETTMNLLLGRALYYMPIFESELIKQKMPLELKLLPVVESSLKPTALSRMGAGGLWQFMPYTGKMYGLKITSLVDERFDPIKSTAAACRYLKDLHRIYDNWTLALAAYNCGPGNVNKAIARVNNAKSFWDIYPYLPRETRDYVPAFIAANYAFTFYKSHNISFDKIPKIITTDTVNITNRVIDLRQISSTIDISENAIKLLNPQFKTWIVPALSKPYTIYLPQANMLEYEMNKEEIFAKEAQYLPKRMTSADIKILEASRPKIYVVRSGDVLGAISRKYRVSVKQIMKLNNLRSAHSLSVGQRLRLS